MTTVNLGWPNAALSPNARVHWRKKHAANKTAKLDTAWLVRAQIKEKFTSDRAKVDIIFHPPDKRRRDLDNMIASTKGMADGISNAIGIDDSKFDLSYRIGEPTKGGMVVVTICQA